MPERETLIEREDVPVMFKRVADEGARGRSYFGAFDNDGEYRICVQLHEGDDPQALGLELGTLPGGRYARLRLTGEPPAVYDQIGPSFKRLSERADRDPSRHRVLPAPRRHRPLAAGRLTLRATWQEAEKKWSVPGSNR